MTGDGHHMAVIVATTVPLIRLDVCVVGVGVDSCPSNADGCVSWSDDIGLSGLVSPPPDTVISFPVIVVV